MSPLNFENSVLGLFHRHLKKDENHTNMITGISVLFVFCLLSIPYDYFSAFCILPALYIIIKTYMCFYYAIESRQNTKSTEIIILLLIFVYVLSACGINNPELNLGLYAKNV